MGALQQALLSTGAAGEFTPSDLPTIWEWWEPERQGLANNDPMNSFIGQAFARDMIKEADGTRPIFETNQINGLGAARFGGAVLLIPNMSALTASHFFLVIKIDNDPPASGNGGLHNHGTSGLTSHYCFTDNNIYEGWGTDTRLTVGDAAASLAAWRVYEVLSISGTFTVRLDGTQLNTRASNTVVFANDATHRLGIITSNFLMGQVAGAYQCSAELSVGDRANQIGYINSRFGLSST